MWSLTHTDKNTWFFHFLYGPLVEGASLDAIAKAQDPSVSDAAEFWAKYSSADAFPPSINNTAPSWEQWKAVFTKADVDTDGCALYREFHPVVDAHWHIANVILDRINADSASLPTPATTHPKSSPTPLPKDECKVHYKFLWDSFNITGVDFDSNKFNGGDGLKKQILGCGALSDWKFTFDVDDPVYIWQATGRLPIGVQGCVEQAITSSGGPTVDQCGGCDNC